jgi:signal transduction histidine kinase
MSLRTRLALLYTSIVGGILLLFGVAVYGAVSYSLISQTRATLTDTAAAILPAIYSHPSEGLTTYPLAELGLNADVFVQVWDRNHHLVSVSDNINALERPIDQESYQAVSNTFHHVISRPPFGNIHWLVYTVPLLQSDRKAGVLQVGISLSVVDATQRVLLIVLISGAVISMTVAGLASWASTQQALAPLGDVTRTALQITRADDLSRRIPYNGPPDDEVGQLIRAFNQTLSRLENLFNTQRRFLADVGHELRTPLTVIKGNVDLMRRFGELDLEGLESIESEVDRLTRLVGDLLLLTQAESGKLPLNKKLVELDTLLLEVMHQMSILARDRLQLRLGEIDQVLVCGDGDKLKQVLVNLIGNAIKYTPAGGSVTLGLGKEDERARLTVSDTGPGIPAEDLAHIFERFYRGEKSRTRPRDGKGFGLGLSIAYWIVRNHGGQIDVNSKEKQGTTFCIWLPLAKDNCLEEAEKELLQ